MPKSDTKKPKKTKKPATTKKSPTSTKRKSRSTTPHLSIIGSYDRDQLTKNLMIDAKGLAIPPAAAELFIQKALDAVETQLKTKKIVTQRDLTSAIAHELKKFSPDFAYIYQNRDKIV